MPAQKPNQNVESPIQDLRKIIEEYEDDSPGLFATALTIFTGSQALFKEENEKRDELESVLMGDSG